MKVQHLRAQAPAYAEFDQLNGEHSYRRSVPGGYVDYQARTRHGGKVVYFNFALAREMGLIPEGHPDSLNERLERKLLDTFSLVIINEYDIHHKIRFVDRDIRPNRYMATRYLQLQHPDRRGTTSGDGRGIWNGEFRGRGGVTWDVTSSGTGATRLSPAAAQTGKHFRTGDKRVGYGNGYNTLDEGLSAALMSEIFHQNGIATERTLVIIGFSGEDEGTSINVRAGRNLMRPSHFFCHLRQGNLEALRGAVDHYVDRQARNGDWPSDLRGERRYRHFAEQMARAFARSAARFESEYIFCWMDWDGDNILADGGIIDYGSVRQFGMYYGDYRYDDVERFSTRLPEQRLKARYIVQCFAQARDFLLTGRKRNVRRFRNDPVLDLFDREFETASLELLLGRAGYSSRQRDQLLKAHPSLVRDFRRAFTSLERVRSKKGVYSVPDGENRDTIYCMRSLLREYPRRLLEVAAGQASGKPRLGARELTRLMAASSASARDLKLTPGRERRMAEFETLYEKLCEAVSGAEAPAARWRKTCLELAMRSSVINKRDRITGDAAILVTESLIRWHKRVPRSTIQEALRALIAHQRFIPVEAHGRSLKRAVELEARLDPWKRYSGRSSRASRLVLRNLKVIRKHREGL